jgi:hypothetical protein
MQDINNQPLLRGRVKTHEEHISLTGNLRHFEFVLFGDNILECFTLLNPAIEQNDIWEFQYVIYKPIDQPIYVFKTKSGAMISVKVCGVYTNWPLPSKVSELIYRYDLPDFVLYNISADKVVLAGEFTETASVGNSQWQRELRKIAAAELGIPFIYQTVYSSKDDSRDTIREPTSLLAYNAFIYSLRYQVSSLVFFIETNIETSRSRYRKDSLNPNVLSRLFSAYILNEVGEERSLHLEIERSIYLSMAKYMQETPYPLLSQTRKTPRLVLDLPCVNEFVASTFLQNAEEFVSELAYYLHNPQDKKSQFRKKFELSKFNMSAMKPWTDKRNTAFIKDLFDYIEAKNLPAARAPRSKFAAGIVETSTISGFLADGKFNIPDGVLDKIEKFTEAVVIPVSFHKNSNGVLQFTKDPYAGNTAAFAELFGFDMEGNQQRTIITYCVSTNPIGFDIHNKNETNIYRSVAKYSDVLIIDSKEIITKFKPPTKFHDTYEITAIDQVQSLGTTEDMAVVATYLQMGVIASDWDVCMIAIHHSSWQQIRIRDISGFLDTAKIGRNNSKVDLVMQSQENMFLAGEGKRRYTDFFASSSERNKIETAFNNIRSLIDDLYKSEMNKKIIAFICLLDVPPVDWEFFLEAERRKISESIAVGHLNKIANQDFVVIGSFVISGSSYFELFFSKDFDSELKNTLIKIFEA